MAVLGCFNHVILDGLQPVAAYLPVEGNANGKNVQQRAEDFFNIGNFGWAERKA